MADETEETVADTATNETKEPFLSGTYRGKPVTWDDADKARKHAQMGLDYETKMAELSVQRESLNQEGQQFGEWKEWKRALASDPKRSKAMQKAWDDPEGVLASKSAEPEGDLEADGNSTQRSLPPEMLALRAQVEQLQSTITQQLGQTQETQLSDRLGRVAESFDFLKGNEAATRLAVSQAAHYLTTEPDASPEGAMAAIVEELRQATTTSQQRKLERNKEGEQLRTVPASEGTPNPGPKPKEHDPSDLKFGKIRERVMLDVKKNWGERFPNL